eukprot:gene1581-32969_t
MAGREKDPGRKTPFSVYWAQSVDDGSEVALLIHEGMCHRERTRSSVDEIEIEATVSSYQATYLRDCHATSLAANSQCLKFDHQLLHGPASEASVQVASEDGRPINAMDVDQLVISQATKALGLWFTLLVRRAKKVMGKLQKTILKY